MLIELFVAMAPALQGVPPLVVVDHDNVEIRQTCRVRVAKESIIDADRNGVIHISGDGITVIFEDAPLHGATPESMPDDFTGIGIRITGKHVTLSLADVSGYKVGVHALYANGLRIFDCDLSGNFRQRLGSTPRAEDAEDWLWPHDNNAHQWLENYGAGLYIEYSDAVTIHDILIRDGQNGIVLDRVNDSRIYDNDCSFLSGWGLALWRSSRNVVTRNAFDFCVRGYSHGVYNRGQDSAGILLFEQCDDNLFAENSATHGGDGFFAFSGNEALGQTNLRDDESWYERRGHTGNRLINNDFSYAAAHGVELTFGFDNLIDSNRIVGNAICGIWGGYSQDTTIAGNTIEDNGDMAYGLERGGINIEHGRNNVVFSNAFRNNACGVHLWWDDDTSLLETPWAKVNEKGSADTLIHHNTFEGDTLAVHLRRTTGTMVALNTFTHVGREYDLLESRIEEVMVAAPAHRMPEYEVFGERHPIGARAHLRGRKHILIEEWGPYDWQQPLLHLLRQGDSPAMGSFLEYRVLGSSVMPEIQVHVTPAFDTRVVPFQGTQSGEVERVRVYAGNASDKVRRVDIDWRFAGHEWHRERHLLMKADWSVKHFASPVDPREDVKQWRLAAEDIQAVSTPALDFTYAMKGPPGLDRIDHFGTIAVTTLSFPAGAWRLRTSSDDGIRVWIDDELVVDDWTWHSPRSHEYEWTLVDPDDIDIRVEHFELDGYAVLRLDFETAD